MLLHWHYYMTIPSGATSCASPPRLRAATFEPDLSGEMLLICNITRLLDINTTIRVAGGPPEVEGGWHANGVTEGIVRQQTKFVIQNTNNSITKTKIKNFKFFWKEV